MPPGIGRLVYIEVVGYREAAGKFARASQALIDGQRNAMRDIGRRYVSALRAEAPRRSGRLAAGISYRTQEMASGTSVSVTSAAPYTGWVIRGRGPVYARRAKALRFQPVYGGPFIFRRSVGPAKANPFHRRAFARLGMEPNASANKVAVEVERAFAAY